MVKNISKNRLEDLHIASLNDPLIDTFQRSLLNLWLGFYFKDGNSFPTKESAME